MPGHVLGISVMVSMILNSEDPMSYTAADWRDVERALRSLRGRKLGKHVVREVTVVTMQPTASSISKHGHR